MEKKRMKRRRGIFDILHVMLLCAALCTVLTACRATDSVQENAQQTADPGVETNEDSGALASVPDDVQPAAEDDAALSASAVRLPGAPLLLQFSSGAGAWGTLLTLQPDGSFTGVYHDTDMGSNAPEYPNGTYYVSDFSGRFEDFEQISDTVWSMRLAELTNENEVGETWVEAGMLHIASEAHGIAGGEEFLFCAPLTPVDDLPPECRTWHPEAYRWRQGERELLQSWAICNVSTGEAFFSEGILS